MAVRKRYYIWLAKAYLKRWKSTIMLSTIVGIIVFFLAIGGFNYFIKPALTNKIESVGYTGTYTLNSPPEEIFQNVSYGLTKVDSSGDIKPGAAERWEIKDSGKKYVFYIKEGQYFHNGEELTAENLPLNFEEAKKEVVDTYTVAYILENEYSPFLTSVSKPILTKDLDGLGKYKIQDIELNASFIKSVTLENVEDLSQKKKYFFYPTEDALKTAYALGEIDRARGITDLNFQGSEMSKWTNTRIDEEIDYGEIVAIFYNNNDDILSDKKVRQALNTALPQKFSTGKRADGPIPPNSIFYQKNTSYLQGDLEIAKELLDTSSAKDGGNFEITTTEEYEKTAEEIQKYWEKIGIKTSLKIVKKQPETFQIYLTKYNLPKDPDQYTLWHSDQRNNIVGYKNLRIDKLLEDGRVTHSIRERKDIYADFQKYLIDDVPASFLYFPISYTLARK